VFGVFANDDADFQILEISFQWLGKTKCPATAGLIIFPISWKLFSSAWE